MLTPSGRCCGPDLEDPVRNTGRASLRELALELAASIHRRQYRSITGEAKGYEGFASEDGIACIRLAVDGKWEGRPYYSARASLFCHYAYIGRLDRDGGGGRATPNPKPQGDSWQWSGCGSAVWPDFGNHLINYFLTLLWEIYK